MSSRKKFDDICPNIVKAWVQFRFLQQFAYLSGIALDDLVPHLFMEMLEADGFSPTLLPNMGQWPVPNVVK